MMNSEPILFVLFGIVIVILLFLVILMHRRIYQLLTEMNQLENKMTVTSAEIEELTKKVKIFKDVISVNLIWRGHRVAWTILGGWGSSDLRSNRSGPIFIYTGCARIAGL